EDQVRYFSRRYRVVTYNHRGYPPSSVPKAASDYSQDLLVDDLLGLVQHLGLGSMHLVGCSMGANAARDFTLANPGLVRSLIMVGAGAGSLNREQFLASQAATAEALDQEGWPRYSGASRPCRRARRSGRRIRAASRTSSGTPASTTPRRARISL